MVPTTNLALLPSWLDAEKILSAFGPYAFVIALCIIFAECGLLVGFFLPGDSLLFMTGLFIAHGAIDVPLWLACVLLVLVACLGNLVGYWIGYRAGPAIFNRPNSKLFRQEYVDKTHEFFERYGSRAIVLARFVPIVRTFLPFVAGAAEMSASSFLFYNVAGGVGWVTVCVGAGFIFGNVPIVKENFTLVTIGIVIVSVLPMVYEVIKHRKQLK